MQAWGPEAVALAIETYFGADLDKAWFTVVYDKDNPAEWRGGRWEQFKDVILDPAFKGSAYCNTTLVAGDSRAGATLGCVICLDDVGVKLDLGMAEMFAPAPTLKVLTSTDNLQWHYAIRPHCSLEAFGRLKRALKASSLWREAVKDATGDFIQYVRLPTGFNNKPGLKHCRTKIVGERGPTYTIEELALKFNVDLTLEPQPPPVQPGASAGSMGFNAQRTKNLDPSETTQDLELLARVVKSIDNGPRFADVLPYMGVLYAIKGAGGESAYEIAMEWAYSHHDADGASIPQVPADDPERRWKRLKTPETGLGLLLDLMDDKELSARISWGIWGSPLDEKLVQEAEPPAPPPKPETLKDILAKGALRGLTDFNTPGAFGPEFADTLTLVTVHDEPMSILPGFDRGEITIIGGQGGSFKSQIALQLGLAIAFDRPDMMGSAGLRFAGDVVIFSHEDSRGVIERRINAATVKHKLDWTKQAHLLHLRTEQLFVRNDRGKRAVIELNETAVRKLMELVEKRDVAMIIDDTLASSVEGASEETNSEFQQIVNHHRALARMSNSATVLLHHLKKKQGLDKSASEKDDAELVEMLRGGSALGSATRNAFHTQKMTSDEARKFGISEQARKTISTLRMIKRSHGVALDPIRFRLETESVQVRDRATGVLSWRGEPALVVDASINAMGELRVAWDKLKAAQDQGMTTIRKMDRGAGRTDNAQFVWGLGNKETNALLTKLEVAGMIRIRVENVAGHNSQKIIDLLVGDGNPAVAGDGQTFDKPIDVED